MKNCVLVWIHHLNPRVAIWPFIIIFLRLRERSSLDGRRSQSGRSKSWRVTGMTRMTAVDRLVVGRRQCPKLNSKLRVAVYKAPPPLSPPRLSTTVTRNPPFPSLSIHLLSYRDVGHRIRRFRPPAVQARHCISLSPSQPLATRFIDSSSTRSAHRQCHKS